MFFNLKLEVVKRLKVCTFLLELWRAGRYLLPFFSIAQPPFLPFLGCVAIRNMCVSDGKVSDQLSMSLLR